MPGSPAVRAGSRGDDEQLRRWVAESGPQATRAAIVLLAAGGARNADIARELGVSRQTVSTWRQRYAADGLDGLRDRPHPGRPSVADEADIVTRMLLAAAGHRSTRAIARDTGLSHTLVASVRQRWNLAPDHSSVPAVPARPPLPGGEIWVLGLYHDAHRTVMLLGSYPRRAARPAAAAVRASTLDAVDAALDAAGRAALAGAASSAGTDSFASFLLEGRGRHPDVRLHAVVLRGGADGAELAGCCARAQVTHHLLPPRTTWRSFTRAVIGIDGARHPESSQRVHLDLTAALNRYATQEPRREPVRWLREALPVQFGDRAPMPTARRRAAGSGVNQIDLGSFNECVVIEAIRLAGSITRGEISERTRLTQQSVSRITRSLIQRGLLVEDRQRYASVGKPRTPVRLRDDAAHAVGIHVDPEVLTVVVVELSGSIVAGRSERFTAETGPQALVDQLAALTETVLAAAGHSVEDETFLGIGVATPGPVDTESGTILDPPLMPVWRDVPLLSLLKKRFTCPIVIEKDSTAAAVGERWIGRERRARDFVYLYLGTGVGAGLFLNGDIYRGLTANAGEFGQLCAVALGRVDSDGRPEILPECNPVASVPALTERASSAGPARSVPADPSAAYQAACEAAVRGEGAADAIRQVAAAIGRGALGMVDLLDVGLVVVGGPFCTDNVASLYLTEIERVVNAFPMARRMRRVSVERSVNGQEAAAVGAASTIFHTTFTPRLRGLSAPSGLRTELLTERITLRFDAPGTGFVPYWRTCIGAGRAAEGLRAAFQQHLEMVQRDMPFGYLRVHGIFHEDMMVYREEAGKPVLNWQYVDLLYDHWLSVGIRPFVEIGFMPHALASGDQTVFWWQGNVTPPRDWDRWEWLVGQFAAHLADRYGLAEVRRWYFEVWNEPNLDIFWQDADFAAYLELYRRTTRAVKAVDPRLRVGGPASSGSGAAAGKPPWGSEFLAACQEEQLPVDFFSTHPYPTIHTADLSGEAEMTWDGPDRLHTDLTGAQDTLISAGYPGIERHYTEWSSSPSPRDRTHDTAFMAPFIVRNCWLGRGLTDSLSYWTVSDIFEENRLGDTPFHGGFGLVSTQGLKKPSYHGYQLLSRLGTTELASGSSYAATRREDGSLVILLWNYCHYRDSAHFTQQASIDVYQQFEPGPAKRFELAISHLDGPVRVQTTRVDREHGSVYDAWVNMGAPSHLRPADREALQRAAEPDVTVTRLPAPDGRIEWPTLVEPHGVTLLEISRESP